MAGVLNSLEDSILVHLACHGSWRFDEGRCFLQLADGRLLPRHIAGLSLQQHPFVFLNACQVAAGGQALGTPTGFPAELVFAGAAGCITPLWSVRDDQAYEIAVAFYREALAGRAPAELVRELRIRAAGTNLASSTPFAYQFCGHPDLRLTDAATRRAETA
jgi:CHAT domain-containing protein